MNNLHNSLAKKTSISLGPERNVIKKMKNDALIQQVVHYLKLSPQIIDDKLNQPDIRIVFSDYKKKYSQIHRIKVCEPDNNNYEKYFWAKIAVNQPKSEGARKITKEFKVQKELFHHFREIASKSLITFSSSRPVAVLFDFNTILSEECSGTLFNTYLQRRLPLFFGKEILGHCRRAGLWLKKFHAFYKENETDPTVINSYATGFEKKFQKSPLSDLFFLTYCHRDYSPRNVFIDKNRVEVIDFVGMSKGLPQEDLEFFSNYVLSAKFNGLYSTKFKQQMVSSFLQGYGISTPNDGFSS